MVSGSMNYGDDQPQAAHDSRRSFGSRQAVPMHEEGEGEDADKATDFAHSGGYSMSRGTDFYREDLGGIHEGGGIGPELGEEVAEPVDEQKRARPVSLRWESERAAPKVTAIMPKPRF